MSLVPAAEENQFALLGSDDCQKFLLVKQSLPPLPYTSRLAQQVSSLSVPVPRGG